MITTKSKVKAKYLAAWDINFSIVLTKGDTYLVVPFKSAHKFLCAGWRYE